MDDPFSAVDSHVAKHLCDEVLLGYLKGKSILFITNQLQFLPYADRVIVMKDGQIIDQGDYNKLLTTSATLKEVMSGLGDIQQTGVNQSRKQLLRKGTQLGTTQRKLPALTKTTTAK
jgi:ABC-type transport system involved in cytochrome bd biosynthesis fused ATPase/permease subunit